MASSLNGTGVTFSNGSTQSIASAINATADVLAATATTTYGAVGSYTNVALGNSSSYASNATIAGSILQRYDPNTATYSSAGLSGTWRNVSAQNLNSNWFGDWTANNLLVRVS